MSSDLSPVIAACARWLLTAFPPATGSLSHALAEAQARQAATIAAALRYPTAMDAELLNLVGPGGSDRLDSVTGTGTGTGTDAHPRDTAEYAWRTWVDETVVSWAACLLSDQALAVTATACLAGTRHGVESVGDARRLTIPGPRDHHAAPLLRHPDLLAPIADLHRDALLGLLDAGPATASPEPT
ncbi:hypothetical protein QOM21_11645 [Streptomyces sp. Pv4-95]|uniref:hypothetical protein n=1 Tax=Streptomyces sp. Pv4-95 TaxID=3049543 RepID=UPI003891FAFF